MRGGGVRGHLTSKDHILCQRGHDHRIVAPGPTDRSTHSLQFVGGPALPYDPTYHLLWRVDKVREVCRSMVPDVLEIHSPYVAATSCLPVPRKWFGIRTFFWHSDFIDTHAPRLLSPLWAWVRQITRACDRTIVTSAHMQEKLASHGAVRVERIPMGIDRTVFHPDVPKGERVTLIGAGRLAFEKRWDVVVRAAKILGARLVIYGDGPERAKLEAMGATIAPFETDRSKLASALAGAEVFVHGCPFETFGVAIAEAVACGVPIVVPADGAASEHVHGASGRTYAPGDAESCAAAIRDLLAMDSGERRRAALDAAKRVLSVETHFDRTIALYEAALAERAR